MKPSIMNIQTFLALIIFITFFTKKYHGIIYHYNNIYFIIYIDFLIGILVSGILWYFQKVGRDTENLKYFI